MKRGILILAILGAIGALIWGAGNGVGQAWESHNPTNTPLPIATTDPTAPVRVKPNESFWVLESGNLHQIATGFVKGGGGFVGVDNQTIATTYSGTITVSVGKGTVTLTEDGKTIQATLSSTVCLAALSDGQLICAP